MASIRRPAACYRVANNSAVCGAPIWVYPLCTIVPDTTPDRVNPSCAAEMVQVIALGADPFVAWLVKWGLDTFEDTRGDRRSGRAW